MIHKNADERIEYFLKQNKMKWEYGNSILYRMCEESPYHTDIDEIVGKVWIIGRAYAAAIERRKNATQGSDDFYYDEVGPSLLKHGKELDIRLAELKSYSRPTTENLHKILDTHKFLTDLFFEISGMEKRSLASKYLHFHCPQLFYIYDERARIASQKYVSLNKNDRLPYSFSGFDEEYLKLCLRLFRLQEYINTKYHVYLTPRQLDDLLLFYS